MVPHVKERKITLRSRPFLLLSPLRFELFRVELHRESVLSQGLKIKKIKNRAVFCQGCVQGQNLSFSLSKSKHCA